jgi:hypothetical protein
MLAGFTIREGAQLRPEKQQQQNTLHNIHITSK